MNDKINDKQKDQINDTDPSNSADKQVHNAEPDQTPAITEPQKDKETQKESEAPATTASTSNVAGANAAATEAQNQNEAQKSEVSVDSSVPSETARKTKATAKRNLSAASSAKDASKAESEDSTGSVIAREALGKTHAHPDAKWYIIHTYSGHENKVSKSLKQRVQSLGFEDRIFEIIVPTRNTIKVSQGKKETVKEKIFPGYVLVRMVLDDESWLLVRTTQGVTAFIGAGNKPTPISQKEVEAIQKFMAAEEPLYKTSFTVGEAVKITDGPFNDFLGTIDDIDEAKGKLKVLVSIFGRETPVELDFLQVKKL